MKLKTAIKLANSLGNRSASLYRLAQGSTCKRYIDITDIPKEIAQRLEAMADEQSGIVAKILNSEVQL